MHMVATIPTELDPVATAGATLSTRAYAHRGVRVSDEIIRVMVVDDHALVRAGLRAMLSGVPDMAIIGEATNGAAAVDVVRHLQPRVVVMDLEMPDGDGESATRALTALEHPPRVLILTMHEERERLLALLQAGAAGYLAKDTSRRELLDAIRVVADGDTYVRPAVARHLATAGAASPAVTRSARAIYETLSEREQAVLRLTAQGLNGPEIGRRLAISAKTVDTYKQRIHAKTGLENRVGYVRFALEAHLLDDDRMPARPHE